MQLKMHETMRSVRRRFARLYTETTPAVRNEHGEVTKKRTRKRDKPPMSFRDFARRYVKTLRKEQPPAEISLSPKLARIVDG